MLSNDHLNANHHSFEIEFDILFKIKTIAKYYFQIKLFFV